jgi:hypothetical protein
MKKIVSAILALTLLSISSQAQTVGPGPLPPPIVTENSVEICLNSRYSQHSLRGTASIQQISNIVWAAGRAPITGSYRNIYIVAPTGTYFYDPNSHSLTWHSSEVKNDGAFQIRYESELDFDSGVSFMPALLASVSLCRSTESQVATCPKGIGYPKARLIFGVQTVKGLSDQLVVHSSVPQSQIGYLPDPCTAGVNSFEDVLANLNFVDSFSQTNLTPQQISQILWAGYGCSAHVSSNGRAGLTVPSAYANYYLTQSIYLVNENGVFRYQNRNPSTNMATRDHRLEQLGSTGDVARRQPADVDNQQSADIRGALQSAVGGLPQAPCYVILCLDSSYIGQEYARLETGFVAGNILIQSSAIGLGCHFKTGLTSTEQKSIQTTTNILTSHIPQAIVSIGQIEVPVSFSVALQGHSRPDAGWIVPLTVKFFPPGADIFNDTAVYEFNLTTTKSADGNEAVCEAPNVEPGTYDIAVRGESTLMNVKKGVVISLPKTSVDLGTLLEGDANQDNMIDFADFAILSINWLIFKTNGGYDNRADFDRNGLINSADLYLLTANWLKRSPVEIQP